MTDKNNSKFPYIILPNLSGDRNNNSESSTSTPLPTGGRQGQSHEAASKMVTSPIVKLPRIVASSKVDQGQDPSGNPKASTSTSTMTKQPSKGMSRHIALSKQYAAVSTPSSGPPTATPQISKEFLALRQEALKAQYDMRSSARSFYPSTSTMEGGGGEDEGDDTSGDASRKLDLEALSQLLPHPHRSKQLKSTRIQETINPQQKAQNSGKKPASATPSAAAAAKSFLEKVRSSNSSSNIREEQENILDQLKTRIEGLTVHVKNRDAEVSKLKDSVVELQLMVLKEKQESSGTNELMERLSMSMEALSNKLEHVEDKLMHQETSIINKLLLIDEMGSSESDDSDYGKVECKPTNWMTSSSSSSTTIPVKSLTNVANPGVGVRAPNPGHHAGSNSYNSGINSLKECVNWVPIAPDFDKLLNVIALLNFRMDRNQSMQLSRNGNEVTFKHADTIPLVIYKNGLTLANTGFRSYATLSVIKLINEMFSGYFPSELHSQYPDGIVFVVSDKRSLMHELCPGFNGPGVKLLSDPKSAPILLPGAERLSLALRKSDLSLKSNVLKSNSDLSIASCASDASLTRAPCCILPDLNKLCKSHGHSVGHKMICLKLKNISNGHLYKLRLATWSTIDAVLEHLEKHLSPVEESSASLDTNGSGDSLENCNQRKIPSAKFDIVLPLPYGILTSGNSTLKDYGLVTNTLLYIQPTSELQLLTNDCLAEEAS